MKKIDDQKPGHMKQNANERDRTEQKERQVGGLRLANAWISQKQKSRN